MNWNMVGHEWAVTLLQQQVASARFRHAYLFTGPRGVGRRTLGLRFAQAINCLQPPTPGEFCGLCRSCTFIELMKHPDLAVVQAEQIGGTLKVEQIRELQHSLALAPYEARFRVALLLRFEEAHPGAANALLKILEEPPTQVILLLTADSSDSLPPTIVSRCDVIRLRSLSLDSARKALHESWNLPAEQARLLAHISGGRPGYALQLARDGEIMNQRNTALEQHKQLLSDTRLQRLKVSDKLTDIRNKESSMVKERVRKMLEIWLSLWRDVLITSMQAEPPITNLDREEEINNLASVFGQETAYTMVTLIQETLDKIERNTNMHLALDILMLDLPRIVT